MRSEGLILKEREGAERREPEGVVVKKNFLKITPSPQAGLLGGQPPCQQVDIPPFRGDERVLRYLLFFNTLAAPERGGGPRGRRGYS